MPPWSSFEPFLISGPALGGVYALSGVGLVVLYRATGVLYLAFGAGGAMGAFLAYDVTPVNTAVSWQGWLESIGFCAGVTLGYGVVFGPPLAGRGPLTQAVCTLGLALVLFGAIDLVWPTSGGQSFTLTLPTDNYGFVAGGVTVNSTQ